MTMYKVNVHREDKWWIIHVPELDGINGVDECVGQSRRLADVENDARDIIGLVADVAPSTIDLRMRISVDGIGDDLADVLSHIAEDRAIASEAEQRAIEASRAIARQMRDHGVPVRDIATVTGVSYQRAQQLVSS
ncbi:hypothetical protein [Gordonia hydrophobica]|uniref:HicB family toxin-antitoxin system n=1 Tax=Gordonia hydrophobica TaxID=40516 RepID=A0ABZ2U1M4_9ACTN|nr:hypothetical protein [Gordonia hydrophobica]MBM7368575.1 type II secretory pathway component PulM [Gordonia hydrophobica]